MYLVENFLSFQMDYFIFPVGAFKGGKNAAEVDPFLQTIIFQMGQLQRHFYPI